MYYILHTFQKLPQGLLNCYQEAQMVNNIAKNKYKAIYPCKHFRQINQQNCSSNYLPLDENMKK